MKSHEDSPKCIWVWSCQSHTSSASLKLSICISQYVKFHVRRIAKQCTHTNKSVVLRCSPHPGLLPPLPLLLITTCMFWINRLIIPPPSTHSIPCASLSTLSCSSSSLQLQSAVPAVCVPGALATAMAQFLLLQPGPRFTPYSNDMEHAGTLGT